MRTRPGIFQSRACAAWLALVFSFVLALHPALVAAQAGAESPPATPERMEQLLSSIDLPLTGEVFGQFIASVREGMSNDVVVGVGKGARLDPEWKPGNYHFEQARELVRKSIAKAEEAEPLFNFSARVLARELRVGWTDQDVEFLTAFAGTPLGHKMTDWLDAFIAPMLVRDWSKDPKYNPRLSERMREIGRIADQRLLTLTPELAVASRGHEAEVRRMEGLVKSFNSEAGRVIGLRIGGRSLARVMIIMRDITPELEPIVNEYKRQRGGTQI